MGDGHLRVRARDGRHAVQLHQRVATGAVPAADEPTIRSEMAMPRRWIARRRRSCARSFETRNTNDSARGGSGTSSTRTCGSRAWTFSPFSAVTSPQLSPRRRNVVTDPALQKALERGDVPWRRGRSSRIRRRWRCSNVSDLAVTRVIQRGGRERVGERARAQQGPLTNFNTEKRHTKESPGSRARFRVRAKKNLRGVTVEA